MTLRATLTSALVAVAATVAGLLADPAHSQRPSSPLDRPLRADLDGDGAAETVRIRETACFGENGTRRPPCPSEGLRTLVIEAADTCGGRERAITLSRAMDAVSVARIIDADRDGRARELLFELRAGASGRGVQAKVVAFRAGPGGCLAVRRTLFSFPAGKRTAGRRPRGTSFSTGAVTYGEFTKRRHGPELRVSSTYARPTDAGCCPSFARTTYWTFQRGAYRAFMTKLARVRRR